MIQVKQKTISRRQVAIIAFIVSVGTKFFGLPVLMMQMGGRIAWLPFITFLLIDLLVLAALVISSSLAKGKTAFKIIESCLGRILSKIIFIGVFFILLTRALLLLFNISGFFSFDLFDGVPFFIILMPLCLIIIPFANKSLRTLGRTSEILIFFIAAAIIILGFLMAKTSDPISIMPLFGSSDMSNLGRTFLSFSFFFGDISALFIAIGKVDGRKKGAIHSDTHAGDVKSNSSEKQEPSASCLNFQAAKNFSRQYADTEITAVIKPASLPKSAIIAVIAAIAVSIAYAFLIFSSYMDIRGVINSNSVAFATHTAVTRFAMGRFDKIIFATLASALLVSLALLTHAGTRTLKHIVPKVKKTWACLFVALALYISAVFINRIWFLDFIFNNGIYFTAALSGGFVLLLLVCSIIVSKRKRRIGSR